MWIFYLLAAIQIFAFTVYAVDAIIRKLFGTKKYDYRPSSL